MQVSTVLEIKNLSAEGYYSVAGCRGLQLRVTKYGKEFYYRYTWHRTDAPEIEQRTTI